MFAISLPSRHTSNSAPQQTKNKKKPSEINDFRGLLVRVVRLERTVSWSQTRRDTNFAIPGYSLFCHDTTARGKNKVFSVCGHLCGQSRFYAVFRNRGKSRKHRRHKTLRRFALPRPGYRHGTPEGWSDIFGGHFRAFPHLSARDILQRCLFQYGSFHLFFPRLGHGLGQDRKSAAQKLRRCKQRIGEERDKENQSFRQPMGITYIPSARR